MVGMIATPAFDGANFDTGGGCLRHPEIKLTQKTVVDGGKTVVYRELMSRCPKCTPGAPAPHHRKSSSSSSSHTKSEAYVPRDSPGRGVPPGGRHAGGNKSYVSRHSSGLSDRARSKSPAPSERGNDNGGARSRPRTGQQQHRRRSKSPARARSRSATIKPRKVYDTPFDAKGRCHHHPNLQLAKKKLTGGWKVRRCVLFLSAFRLILWNCIVCTIHHARLIIKSSPSPRQVLLQHCPKCLEDEYINKRSVGGPRRSARSGSAPRAAREGGGKRGKALVLDVFSGCFISHYPTVLSMPLVNLGG